MAEPTEGQVKEFWGRCGFKIERIPGKTPYYVLYEPNKEKPNHRGGQYNIWIGRLRGDKLQVEELYPPHRPKFIIRVCCARGYHRNE
ncbi:hypothetical protein LCGC14_1050020 [marine sediment metagenome]|uniref:Uncharacterized protein n=1 Tax=marine sediment metagenome TaxID=412755 RepID=A0A0F9Q757_9ZZZZ